MGRPPKVGTRTFIERYDEMHDIGIPDWQIAQRLGYTATSLVRMLIREHRTASQLLQDIANDEQREAS